MFALTLENLIYCTVFLLPTYLIKFNIGWFHTNLFEVLVGIILVWQLASKGFRKKYFFGKTEAISVSLIFIGLVLSFLVNNFGAVGLGIIKSWFVIPVVFLWIIRENIPNKKKNNMLKAFYISGLGVSLIALGYLVTGKITFDGRLQAFFNSPNYLAMYLAPAIIIGTVFIIEKTKAREKIEIASKVFDGALVFLPVILLIFFFTFSYAAWAAVAAALGAVWIIRGVNKKEATVKIISTIIVSLFLLGSILLSQVDSQKMRDLVALDERSSLSSRIMIWKSAAKILKDNWIMGVGPGNFQQTYLQYQKYFPPYLEWAVPHPHNIFLAFWLQTGIIGLAGFMGLIIVWFWKMLKKKDPRDEALYYATLGIMIYILLHGLVDTTYFKNDLAVIFWLCFIL